MTSKSLSLIAVIIGLSAIVIQFLPIKKDSKVAYINTPKLINEYEGMKAARLEYQSKTKMMQANVDTLVGEMEQAFKDFEKDRPSMTEKELKLSQELLQNKRQQLMQYQQATQQKIQEEENKLNESVMAQVNSYLKDYGKESGYEIILGATTMGNIIYAEEYLDITNNAIEGLNNEYSSINE